MGRKRAMMIGLDGADPVVVKRLLAEGRLPNMKKILEMGVATENMDMLGVFPTVTPPNWTTLATGNYPRTHGITCFYNQTLGRDLDISESNWDSRRVESELLWEAFEDEGKRAIMLNYCQAWPNRVPGSKNVFVDGGGVIPFLRITADFQKICHLDESVTQLKEIPHFVDANTSDCVVYDDQIEKFSRPDPTGLKSRGVDGHFKAIQTEESPMLERKAHVTMNFSVEEMANGDAVDRVFSPLKEPKNWAFDLDDSAKEAALILNKGLTRRYGVVVANADGVYDQVIIYENKKNATPLGSAKKDQWSEFIYDTFNINDQPVKVAYRIRVLGMAEDGSKADVYISHVMKIEEDRCVYPRELFKEMMDTVGPMPYFSPIERYTDLGDQVAVEAFRDLTDWHAKATDMLFEKYNDWQLFYIHLHSIDLMNHWYINQSIPGSHPDWQRHREVIDQTYVVNDEYLGSLLKHLDGDTVIFVCADHAAIPRSAGYNNPGIGELTGVNGKVMMDLGYTALDLVNEAESTWEIDWSKTRAIQHRTSHVYINLKGRDPQGIVEPEDYDKLVQQIISDLYAYRDPVHGERVVSFCMTREEMECIGMGGPHCGDIFFQLTRDFGLEHANTPNHVSNHGYSVGCLCLMVGAGLKQGVTISRPIRNVDIVPTMCHIVGNRMPKHVEGGIIYQALAE